MTSKYFVDIKDQIRECTHCSIIKSFLEFDKCSRNLSGIVAVCKECRAKEESAKVIKNGGKSKYIPQEYLDSKSRPCTECGIIKSFIEFGVNNNISSGVTSVCKECHAKKEKERRDCRYLNVNEFLQVSGKIVCKECLASKSVDLFPISISNKNGRSYVCKDCLSAKSAQKNYIPDTVFYKVCCRCGLTKLTTEFVKNKRTKGGIAAFCIECDNRRHAEKNSKKRKEDINFAISQVLRTRVYNALAGKNKVGSAVRDLGCTVVELICFLENKFQEHPITREMMCWENWGRKKKNEYGHWWEIDHIIPLSRVDLTDREQFLLVCSYCNLQPLWHEENSSKNNKMPEEYQIYKDRIKKVG